MSSSVDSPDSTEVGLVGLVSTWPSVTAEERVLKLMTRT
jgi:hypothetical protein